MTALNSVIPTYAALGSQAALTQSGSVLGALSLSGVEPVSLSVEDKRRLTQLLRNVLQRLPFQCSLSQYYFHYQCPELAFKPRSNSRAQLVSSRRAQFLNHQRELYQSRLYWVIDVHHSSENQSSTMEWATLCVKALFDKHHRAQLKQKLSYQDALLLQEKALVEQLERLDEALDNLSLGLSFRSVDNPRLNSNELFHLQKSLVTLSPNDLTPTGSVPPYDWDTLLAGVDAQVVLIDGVHYLKISGSEAVYARIASIQGCGLNAVPEAAWIADCNPVLEKGNYLLFTRFVPFDKKDKRAMVSQKEDDLYRSQLKVSDMVFGTASASVIQQRIQANPRLKEVMDSLEHIANDQDNYGQWLSYVVIFDTHLPTLKDRVKRLKNVLENADFHLLWENIGLLDAYKTMLLGCHDEPLRAMHLNSTQVAALSLFFRSHEGIPHWQFGAQQEEAVYVLESDDGVPFHYTPFVGDKCLVIGVGPTRSGKTFLKLCIATHFLKLGGMYCAMDIDEGSEPLARFFKEDSAVFCLKDTQQTKGFNPFSMCQGAQDDGFVRHMKHLIRLMLAMNEAVDYQSLTPNEQTELERAILLTMGKEGKLRSFSSMLGQCSPSVQKKLAMFRRGGLYGNLFDNDEDAIGQLDKPFSVYNTQGVKDSPALASLINTEIFFRSVRLFESAQYRTRAKFLEVDECQYVLSQPGAAEFLIAKARTWFKHGGGMGFWTQSPQHYSALDEWSTLRSAATTFIFMSDPEMNASEYQEAFPFLTDTECQIIMGLKQKQQAFIKQMDKNIAKVVNLYVEDEQYVIATSRPHEAAIAKAIFESELDVDKAIDRIVEAIKR
ncbi:type IV secretion system protein B4 (plasmid) [Vibrio alfacsensis]|uniref:VirB4 family type IV secretion system protein n=1 Tax=Vibrio alfacsensis TaxID=1074311 RepID=UPI002ADE4BD1|nr:type IV secretion system protein B4 [Vibrio alfacsensis]WQE79453.1 type IV secretion system protein B4 [Vibrio alfacsensis]